MECIFGNGEWTAYTGPFVISEDGIHTIQYRSMDYAGNIEETKEAVIQIDKTAPNYVFKVNGTVLSKGGTFEDCYSLLVKVADNLSSIASAQVIIAGNMYELDPSTSETEIEISFSGRTGNYMARVIIEDYAGNTIEEDFPFTVTTSIQSIIQIIEDYIETGDLKGPLVKQLTNNLKVAQHKLDMGRLHQAAKHIQDFIKHLNNEALAEHVSDAAKEVLNADAEALIRILHQ